jgi:hypothetical protein
VILTVVTITGKVEEEELFRQRFEPGIFLSAYFTSSVSHINIYHKGCGIRE